MWNWIRMLEDLQRRGVPLVLVTVTRSRGSTPRGVGVKMIVLGDGTFHGTIGGGGLERWALDEARRCLKEGTSRAVSCDLDKDVHMPCGGKVDLFMEVLNLRPSLYVFGGGHVGQAVCRVLSGTPFLLHVIDDRAEWISGDRFPDEVSLHPTSWEEFVQEAVWDERSAYVAIVTHSADQDREILCDVVHRPTRYIGMIGSAAKWEKVKGILTSAGISPEAIARVRCPLGIPTIQGKSPQEIAISLAAELLQIHGG